MMDNRSTRRKEFLNLARLNLKTSGAWRIKEAAAMLRMTRICFTWWTQ
jgi:hypothetical protein